MDIYKYEDYEEYYKAQVEANIRKIENIWVKEESIKLIADFVFKHMKAPYTMLCHGTRNGAEMQMFKKEIPGIIEIYGTEISPTARNYEHTVQHDFHKEKYEWVRHFDLVYSNSLDHSYEPEKAVKAWLNQLSHRGFLILEWTGQNHKVRVSDPFAATLEEIKKFMEPFANLFEEKQVPLRVARRKYQTLLFYRNNL